MQENINFANTTSNFANLSRSNGIKVNGAFSTTLLSYTNQYVTANVLGTRNSANLYFTNSYFTANSGDILNYIDNSNNLIGQATINAYTTDMHGSIILNVNNVFGVFANTLNYYLNNETYAKKQSH